MFWILDKLLKFFKPPRPEVNERLKQKLEQQRKNRETRPEVEPEPTYTIWFQNGGGRQEGLTEDQMRKQSERYSFDADEVVESGEVTFIDELGEEVGGCFKEKNDV